MSATEPTLEEHVTASHRRMRDVAASGALDGPPPLPGHQNKAAMANIDALHKANSKFNDTTRGQVLAALHGGHTDRMAASMAGIDVTNLRDWITRGARDLEAGDETGYAKFCTDVRRAVALATERAMKVVRDKMENAGPEQLKSAIWYLEHAPNTGMNPKHEVEVVGDGGGPVVIKLEWPGARTAAALNAADEAEDQDDDIEDAVLVEPDGTDLKDQNRTGLVVPEAGSEAEVG